MVLDATVHVGCLICKDYSHTPWKVAVKLKKKKTIEHAGVFQAPELKTALG